MTIVFLAMGFAAFAWGALSDRFGRASSCCWAACCWVLGLALASRATSLIEFQLLFGIIIGVAAGAFFAPMMAVASGWFEHEPQPRRGAGLGRHGHGAADVAPFARWLITTYDWRTGDAGDRHRGLGC